MIGSRFVVCRNGLATRTGRLIAQTRQSGSSTLQQEASKFFERHAKRASPMSPYMFPFAYKFQITSVLSITHRITGLGLGVLLYGIGIAELCYSNLSFEQILQKLQALPSSLVTAAKVAAGTSIAFHTFNGVRHLAWDAGYGFAIKDLYKSGYAVLGLTLITMAYVLINASQ